MNIYYLLGLFCGLFVGIFLIFTLFRFTRTDKKRQLKYDERQMAIQGKSYKYAFFTVLICNTIYGIAETVSDHPLAEPMAAMLICICIGVFVYAAIGIWKEAYFALNEQPKRIVIIFLAISLINFFAGWRNIQEGNIIKDGTLQLSSCNLICSILLLAVLLVMLFKHLADKREEA